MNAMNDISLSVEPLLRLSQISKRFGRTPVLNNVELEVAPGSFTCLVGPSGCGKTTLLRIICGLETADEGRVVSAGHDITHTPASERQMGLVFQSYALFPNLSVSRNISYGLPRNLGRRETARKVDALLETVGLSGYGRRRPEELSGGQQQRVAIARALAPEPSVLLLDEPLSALDAQLRAQVRGELLSLQKKLGLTTVMVTHDQAEALAIADRIAVMKQGRIVQVGTPFELYCRPADRFVAGFLGHMNFLAAKVLGSGGVQLSTGQIASLHTGDHGAGAAVDLGIRPEDIALSHGAEGEGIALRLQVLRREFLGPTMRLEAVHAGSDATLSLDVPMRLGRTIGEFSEVSVFLPASRIHLFAAGHA